MKIYLVRHGKTEYNQKEIIQGGAVDSSLIEEGINGAIATGKALADQTFSRIYVSPLGRTQQTAGLIREQLKHQPPVTLEDGLREMYFGRWDGQPIQSISNEPQYKNLRQFPAAFDPSEFDGESYKEIVQRGKETFEKIVRSHSEDEKILVVSHGIFITSVARVLTGTPIADLRDKGLVNNTSITVLNVQNGQFSLENYDEIGHLS